MKPRRQRRPPRGAPHSTAFRPAGQDRHHQRVSRCLVRRLYRPTSLARSGTAMTITRRPNRMTGGLAAGADLARHHWSWRIRAVEVREIAGHRRRHQNCRLPSCQRRWRPAGPRSSLRISSPDRPPILTKARRGYSGARRKSCSTKPARPRGKKPRPAKPSKNPSSRYRPIRSPSRTAFAAAAPDGVTAPAPRPPRKETDRAADLHHLAGTDPCHRGRPRRDMDDGDARQPISAR